MWDKTNSLEIYSASLGQDQLAARVWLHLGYLIVKQGALKHFAGKQGEEVAEVAPNREHCSQSIVVVRKERYYLVFMLPSIQSRDFSLDSVVVAGRGGGSLAANLTSHGKAGIDWQGKKHGSISKCTTDQRECHYRTRKLGQEHD